MDLEANLLSLVFLIWKCYQTHSPSLLSNGQISMWSWKCPTIDMSHLYITEGMVMVRPLPHHFAPILPKNQKVSKKIKDHMPKKS